MGTLIVLESGNYAKIQSVRYAFDKCIFTYTIYQKDAHWVSEHQDSFTIGYYDSVEEFITSNY